MEPRPYTGAAWGQQPASANPRNRRGGRPDAVRKMEIEARREQVALLRLSHVPVRAIADILDVGTGTISDDIRHVKAAWRARAAEAYGAHVAEEIAKLDMIERAWLPKATPLHPLTEAEDVAAAEAATRVLDRVWRHRARLLGLEQPKRTEITGLGGGPVRVEASLEAKKVRAHTLLRELEGVAEVEQAAIDASSVVREDEPEGADA